MSGCELPTKWRVVKISVDLSADVGGGSYTRTYAVPDDGRHPMDYTLGELRAYPAASALAMLNEILSTHPENG